jgi:hypothetical protein
MDVDVKVVIFLFIFVLIGIVLFQPIYSEIVCLTTSGTYTTYVTTSSTVTGTTSSFVPNPNYVGSSNVTIVSLVPIFYLLILIVVPAVIVYRMWRSND